MEQKLSPSRSQREAVSVYALSGGGASKRRSSISDLQDKAGEATSLLTALANERRLLVLCHLIAEGELSVGAMAERLGLGQSALSQHLGKLRQHGLVSTRRTLKRSSIPCPTRRQQK